MHLLFEKQKHGRYRLVARRADGSVTSRELQAGYLVHDLMHLAWERAVGARRSFYGQIADGRDLDAFETRPFDAVTNDEGLATEVVVGTLQSAVTHAAPPELLVERARALLETQGRAVPAALTLERVRAVVADFRALAGRYGALRVGEALDVDFADDARADRPGEHDARRP